MQGMFGGELLEFNPGLAAGFCHVQLGRNTKGLATRKCGKDITSDARSVIETLELVLGTDAALSTLQLIALDMAPYSPVITWVQARSLNPTEVVGNTYCRRELAALVLSIEMQPDLQSRSLGCWSPDRITC